MPNEVLTTLIILIASVALGTGVVLYGTSLFQTSAQPLNNKTSSEYSKLEIGNPSKLSVSEECNGLIFSYEGKPDLCFTWKQLYNLAKDNNATVLENTTNLKDNATYTHEVN